MRKTIIYLFITCFFAGIGKTSYAQSYSNFENVGQRAFSIFQSMETMSEDKYVGIFNQALSLLLHTKQISAVDVTEAKTEFRRNYQECKQEGRKAGIKWTAIQFLEFKTYPVEESKGIAYRIGILCFKYNGKEYRRKVRTILYEGKYYLLGL